jgi:undecaprenyl phosphate N,N'-diacetylbacillosamine 1-phosphate transferase
LYKSLFKPLIDGIAAVTGLLVLSPLLLVVIILLCFANNGHPFFFQQRPGKNGKIFSLIKLKTMNEKSDDQGNLLPDELRLTGIGKFIRKTSLDELPQLWNVIIGDMSLVGPRPLLVEYLTLYNEKHKRRHEVKPGITGFAQVNGRNKLTWEQKFDYDVWYVENVSLRTDLKIIGLTIKKWVTAKDINSDTNATMERFTGI